MNLFRFVHHSSRFPSEFEIPFVIISASKTHELNFMFLLPPSTSASVVHSSGPSTQSDSSPVEPHAVATPTNENQRAIKINPSEMDPVYKVEYAVSGRGACKGTSSSPQSLRRFALRIYSLANDIVQQGRKPCTGTSKSLPASC